MDAKVVHMDLVATRNGGGFRLSGCSANETELRGRAKSDGSLAHFLWGLAAFIIGQNSSCIRGAYRIALLGSSLAESRIGGLLWKSGRVLGNCRFYAFILERIAFRTFKVLLLGK